MKWRGVCALWGLLAGALWPAHSAWAQPAHTEAPSAVCTAALDMTPAHLYGLWDFKLWPAGGSESQPSVVGTVSFERHPDYPGSVRGQTRRADASAPALVSGDVIDGEFHLEESSNGIDIDAVWSGVPQPCGHALRGTRRAPENAASESVPLHFLLHKAPGWR